MNPFIIQPAKHSTPTPSDALLCPVCGKDQRVIAQWRRCCDCDDKMTGWNDAEPGTMRTWSHDGIWTSPIAGAA